MYPKKLILFKSNTWNNIKTINRMLFDIIELVIYPFQFFYFYLVFIFNYIYITYVRHIVKQTNFNCIITLILIQFKFLDTAYWNPLWKNKRFSSGYDGIS